MEEIWEPHAPTATPGRRPARLSAGGLELLVTGEVTRSEWADDVLVVGVVGVDGRGGPDPGVVRVEWRVPCVDATAFWTPDTRGHAWLPTAWSAPRRVALTNGAPVAALIGAGDVGLCVFATDRPDMLLGAGVVEESGEFRCWVQASGELTVRIDTSRRHFARCLAGVAGWWLGDRTVTVPSAARRPAYPTWYAAHQEVSPASVEAQAALGKELGLDTIVVDDGWMTTDRARGYGHCGDWDPVSLPDTAAHVRRVNELGVAYLLWYALPFVGRESTVWERFQDLALARVDHLHAIVVDPRHPAVREHLTERLARAVEEWGADGLKIDFVDWFAVSDPPAPGPGADCATVSEGVERLLAGIHERITAADPGAMVEHRQPYVGPGLWPYVSMVRATDCPLSSVENRQRTVDVRLVAGPVAVHSDMLMWHPAEPPERIACQLIDVLFAVPQISVDLAAQTPEQREALAFWLGVFRERADVLQLGTLLPARPDLGYPMITADGGGTVVVARYAPLPVTVPAPVSAGGTARRELLVANADTDPEVRLVGGAGTAEATVRDARGRLVYRGTVVLDAAGTPGGAVVPVPRGGLLTLVPTAEG